MNIDANFRSASKHSDADLIAAVSTAAAMIGLLGPEVVPLFERLEREYHRRAQMRSAMSRAAAILKNGEVIAIEQDRTQTGSLALRGK